VVAEDYNTEALAMTTREGLEQHNRAIQVAYNYQVQDAAAKVAL